MRPYTILICNSAGLVVLTSTSEVNVSDIIITRCTLKDKGEPSYAVCNGGSDRAISCLNIVECLNPDSCAHQQKCTVIIYDNYETTKESDGGK